MERSLLEEITLEVAVGQGCHVVKMANTTMKSRNRSIPCKVCEVTFPPCFTLARPQSTASCMTLRLQELYGIGGQSPQQNQKE